MQPMTKRQSNLLIFLCWLAYAMAYLGRLNYSANITRIMDSLSISKPEAGSIASFFFFAYGGGQLIHGVLNKYYNPRWIISSSLILSAVWNFIMPFCSSSAMMKLFWLSNGFTQAVLWSTLTRVLGLYLDDQVMKKSIIIMGTTTATGTVISYGISAAIPDWRISFYLATVVLTLVGVIWFILYGYATRNAMCRVKDGSSHQKQQGGITSAILVLFGVILLFAVMNNLIKDGLTTWTPSVFKELFKMPSSLSILLTLGLPLLAILGSTVCVFTNRYIKDHVLLCGSFYAISSVSMGIMILCMPLRKWWLTLICFAVCSLMMSAINNVITSLMPLQMRGTFEPGRISGLTNAFCYVGSTISTYALGALAESTGWNGVFYLLLGLSASALLICGIYLALRNKFEKDPN